MKNLQSGRRYSVLVVLVVEVEGGEVDTAWQGSRLERDSRLGAPDVLPTD